jgi:hypothetical protein
MSVGEHKLQSEQQAIQLVVNYWERRPRMMRERLDELLRHGVTHIATFVPWQAMESDISHTLARFLQAVSDRRMTVSLIITPEVGVHYPNSGFPKDIVQRKDNLAQHAQQGAVAINMAPNAFAIPSLFAPEFQKRYFSFLSRMDSFLADLGRSQGDVLRGVEVVVTGSLWKYYRSPRDSAQSAFAGNAGEYSTHANLAFRQRVEQFFAQREFSDPNPAASNRWKTRKLEDTNRRWFFQQSEDVFRNRTLHQLRRKASYLRVTETELYTPEADPSLMYSNVLQMLSGGNSDFSSLSRLIDDYAARSSMASESRAKPYLHWSSLGGFRKLSDPERQFLILKSLLMMGGQGGGIYIDAADWFALSQNFRARTEALARSIASKDLRIRTRALYLTPHLWSGGGSGAGAGSSSGAPLWQELQDKIGTGARLVSSIDLVLREKNADVLIVDPRFIFTRENILKITAWARAGKTLVIPRNALYTEAARAELESIIARTQRIEIALGLPYRLHAVGDGKIFISEYGAEQGAGAETNAQWQSFINAVFAVANIQPYCKVSDSRLAVIPMEKRGGGLGLFLLNGTRRKVSGDVIFSQSVGVSDLSVALSATPAALANNPNSGSASRFTFEVPACGIFPLAVDGQHLNDQEERYMAAELEQNTSAQIAADSAKSELPGLENSVWS